MITFLKFIGIFIVFVAQIGTIIIIKNDVSSRIYFKNILFLRNVLMIIKKLKLN